MTLFILQMLPKLNRNKHLSTPTNTTRPRSFVLFMLHPEPKWLGSKMGLPCLTMREFWTIVATATLWFCLASKAPLLGNTSAKPQTNSDRTRKRRKFQVMKEKRISFVANLRLGLHFFRFRVQLQISTWFDLISIEKYVQNALITCFGNQEWASSRFVTGSNNMNIKNYSIWKMYKMHIVWKLLKMSHLWFFNFGIFYQLLSY